MPKRPALCLHEEILLLALREKEGTVIAGPHYKIALGGAIVAEFLLQKRISVDENKRPKDESGLSSWLKHAFTEKNMVDVVDDKPFDDELLDDCLNRMATRKRRAALKSWVTRFANASKLVQRVAEGLCRRRVLRTTQDKVLLIFNRTIYPEVDPKPERELIERLRKAIFTETRDVDPRTAILLSLANSVELLNIPFDKNKDSHPQETHRVIDQRRVDRQRRQGGRSSRTSCRHRCGHHASDHIAACVEECSVAPGGRRRTPPNATHEG